MTKCYLEWLSKSSIFVREIIKQLLKNDAFEEPLIIWGNAQDTMLSEKLHIKCNFPFVSHEFYVNVLAAEIY